MLNSERVPFLVQLAALRDVVHELEHNLGLDDLTRKERDILLAFLGNAESDPAYGYVSTTERVRAHPTLQTVSQPTFHRALRRLVERGMLTRPEGLPAGMYVISVGETDGAFAHA